MPKEKKAFSKAAPFLAAAMAVAGLLLMGRASMTALNKAKKELNDQQMVVARQTGLAIENNIGLLVGELKLLANQFDPAQLQTPRGSLRFSETFEYCKSFHAADMAYLDSSGVVKAAAAAPDLVGENFSHREYFKQGRGRQTLDPVYEFITFKGASAGKRGLAIAMPVLAGDAAFNGLIVFLIDIKEMVEAIAPKKQNSAEFWIMDAAGRFVVHHNYAPGAGVEDLGDLDASFQEFVTELRRGKNLTAEYKEPDGARKIAAAYSFSIAGQTWSIVSASSANVLELNLLYLGLDHLLGVIAILSAGGFVLASLWFRNKALNREIEERRQVEEKVVEASAFLEEKVKDRTSDLERTKESLEEEIDSKSRLEEALRTSVATFKAVLDGFDAGVYVADMETHELLFINKTCQKLFGDVVGSKCWKIFQGGVGPCDFCTNDKIREIDGVYVWEHFNTVLRRWFHVRDQAIDWPDGRLVRLEIATDITEEKKSQEEYEKKSKLLRAAIDSLPHPFYVIDPENFNVVLANKSSGLTDEDLGQPCYRLTHFNEEPCEEGECQCPLLDVVADKKPLAVEHVHFSPDGKKQIVEVCASPVLDEEGKVVQVIEYCPDVTVRRLNEENLQRAKKAAEAANSAKDDFLSHVSHEIRTPMNGVMGMSELLLQTNLNPKQKQFVETIYQSSHRLLDIVNDVLDFSKIEVGRLKIERIGFNPRDLLNETMNSLKVLADKNNLELATSVEERVPERLVGDPGRLRQILVNLTANAIKFTENGLVSIGVKIQAEKTDDVVLHFSVMDEGPGISLLEREEIFKPFVGFNRNSRYRYAGTGLGLAISSHLVELMGGKIWVESEEGKGSTFGFTAAFQKVDDNPRGSSTDIDGLKQVSALIVADEKFKALKLFNLIKDWVGFADAVVGVAEAKKRLSQQSFSIVLIEIDVSEGTDGFAFAEEIKNDRTQQVKPMVLLTSAGQRGDAAKCRDLGISAYLMTQILQGELLEAMSISLKDSQRNEPADSLITRHSLREGRKAANILIADDDSVNRMTSTINCEQQGWNVTAVENGEEALAALENAPFDLILMDLQMPVLDGLETVKLIREKEKNTGERIPIVAMTAHAMKDEIERCAVAGMDDFLTKPVSGGTLAAMVQKHLADQRGDEE